MLLTHLKRVFKPRSSLFSDGLRRFASSGAGQEHLFPQKDSHWQFKTTLDENYVEFLTKIGVKNEDAKALLNTNWMCNWLEIGPELYGQHLVGKK